VKARVHEMELVTLSPVSVTAGREAVLSPYTDFVQERDSLVYLDPKKVERALANAPSTVMDEFVRGVRSQMDNNRSGFDLRSFLRERLRVTPDDLALRRVPVEGQVNRNQVRRHVTDAGRPFIPGSTIKGALRTALLYHWLVEEAAGKAFVGRMVEEVGRVWQTLEARVKEADRLAAEERGKDANRLARDVQRQTLNQLREFSDEALFGPLNDRRLGAEMRGIRVSDTGVLPPETIRVAEVLRIKVRDATMVSPQWREVIPARVRTRFRIEVAPPFTRPDLAFLNDPSADSLLARVQRFSEDALGWEVDVLESLEDVRALNPIYDAVEDIEAREPGPGAALVRLGGGKTYFDNSLGLAIRARHREAFTRFRRLLGLGRNPRSGRDTEGRFPATRSYVVRNGKISEPLGWVFVRAVRSSTAGEG
jgi:CRISPR-associated protein Csm5